MNTASNPSLSIRNLLNGGEFSAAIEHLARANPAAKLEAADVCAQIVSRRGRRPTAKESWGYEVLLAVKFTASIPPELIEPFAQDYADFLRALEFRSPKVGVMIGAAGNQITGSAIFDSFDAGLKRTVIAPLFSVEYFSQLLFELTDIAASHAERFGAELE